MLTSFKHWVYLGYVPLRSIVFATGEIYHVVNRGVASAPIFNTPTEYKRLLSLVDYYRFVNTPLSFSFYDRLSKTDRDEFKKNLFKNGVPQVELLAYCLMPNHFHFLVRQLEVHGIRKMFTNMQNAYSKYFNLRNERYGPLFQSRFKAMRVETDELFLHVSRYIHLNPTTSYLVDIEDLPSYEWSSYPEYLMKRASIFTSADTILNLIGGSRKYQDFVSNQADYQRQLHTIKHLLLEK